ncbi:MAG: hypothetical protein J6Z79_02180 [Clostridia bacterium]|nr:hypothetical protein [Clostridia bacterium]
MELEQVKNRVRDTVSAVTDAVTGKAAQKRKTQKTKRRVCAACFGTAMFCLGCWAGIHRTVVKSFLLGEKTPKAPDWHFWCR